MGKNKALAHQTKQTRYWCTSHRLVQGVLLSVVCCLLSAACCLLSATCYLLPSSAEGGIEDWFATPTPNAYSYAYENRTCAAASCSLMAMCGSLNDSSGCRLHRGC